VMERALAIAWKDLLILGKTVSPWRGFVGTTLVLAPLLALAALQVYSPGPWRYAGAASALATAALFSALAFVVAVPAATSLALERDRDTLPSLVVSPARPNDLIFGKLLAALATALATKAVALPALAFAYALGGIDAGFIPRYLAVLAAADLSFGSFALYASARPLRIGRLGAAGLGRLGVSQAQLAAQRSVGVVVLMSLVPIYSTLLAVPLALQHGVHLGRDIEAFAPLGALHPLLALVAWGEARIYGVSVPVWVLAISFHVLLAVPLVASAAEAQRAAFAPRGRAPRLGFLLLFAFVALVATGGAWEAPDVVHALAGPLAASALLIVGATAFAQAPPPRRPFGRRDVLLGFVDPRRALASSAESAPGFAFLLAVVAAPFFFLVAPKLAAARAALGVALAAVGIASIGARLAARLQRKDAEALAKALASRESGPGERAEREEPSSEGTTALGTALGLAAVFVIVSPLLAFSGTELARRIPQLDPLVPFFQGVGAFGIIANPFTALEPLTAGMLAGPSVAVAGAEPGTLSALHIAFWGLVVLVSLATLRRPAATARALIGSGSAGAS